MNWKGNWHKRIKPYVNAGYVSATRHPTLPLTLYDYTPTCVYEEEWDEITLRTRGLVIDDQGRRVNAPLKKFFNLEEEQSRELIEQWSDTVYAVQDKLDGSCVFATRYRYRPSLGERLRGRRTQDVVLVHTRGSFVSRQAQEARAWLDATYGTGWMLDGYTYVFEWIAPNNRIVVNYGDRTELVLLTRIRVFDEMECSYVPEWTGPVATRRYLRGRDALDDLKASVPDDEEGYVIQFLNQERIKIKGETYLERHRAVKGLNTMIVWEAAQDEMRWADLMVSLDEEGRMWVSAQRDAMVAERQRLFDQASAFIDAIRDEGQTERDMVQRILAIESDPAKRDVLFSLMRGNERKADQTLWKLVKPRNRLEKFSSGLTHQLG